ncbi:hypothetical protein T310_9215, partial [Rasamsonia emersonii CBS 393.64]
YSGISEQTSSSEASEFSLARMQNDQMQYLRCPTQKQDASDESCGIRARNGDASASVVPLFPFIASTCLNAVVCQGSWLGRLTLIALLDVMDC